MSENQDTLNFYNLIKLSFSQYRILLIITLFFFVISYFFYHAFEKDNYINSIHLDPIHKINNPVSDFYSSESIYEYFASEFTDINNFRGWGLETELIAKGYANNWASAITNEVRMEENQSFLLEKATLIKTERYDENLTLYIEEGKKWMMTKYGFKSKWDMIFYVKSFYEEFFKKHKSLLKYKI